MNPKEQLEAFNGSSSNQLDLDRNLSLASCRPETVSATDIEEALMPYTQLSGRG